MDITLQITDAPKKAVYAELDQNGAPIGPVGTIGYVSDNPAAVTVDPVSGQLAYVGAGKATITGSDSGVAGGLPASGSVTVEVTLAPTTSTLTFE